MRTERLIEAYSCARSASTDPKYRRRIWPIASLREPGSHWLWFVPGPDEDARPAWVSRDRALCRGTGADPKSARCEDDCEPQTD